MPSLFPYNTFGVDLPADHIREFHSVDELRAILTEFRDMPLLPVGQGANLLFLEPFHGLILRSAMTRARAMGETKDSVLIQADAGLLLDDLIAQLTDMNLYGMENLSYIPGTVGASAVQNVGAYGVEAKDVIESVQAISISTLEERTFSNDECQFAYRDSIFKHALSGQYIILSVTYRLHKEGLLHTDYGQLSEMVTPHTTPAELREMIIGIRQAKLPEVGKIGSAGSFFMNPVVSADKAQQLLTLYPNMPHYNLPNGVKIPAAWLIEQCGLKGHTLGTASVWHLQPLVLTSSIPANPSDIWSLAQLVIRSVEDKFAITLQPEVIVCRNS